MTRRRAAPALLAIGTTLALAGCAGRSSTGTTRPATSAPRPPALLVEAGAVRVRIPSGTRAAIAALPSPTARSRLRTLLGRPRRTHGRRWSATIAWGAHDVRRVLAAIRGTGSQVAVTTPVRSVELRLPVIRQVDQNDCEAASMAMLLAGRVDQVTLQGQLPKALPTVPYEHGDTTVWGNPERGFVGLADGYGYGVYDRPVTRLLRRYQPDARNLTGAGLASLLGAVRDGRPVVTWLQLGASQPRTWASPQGRIVRANFAEHAMLLTGYHHGTVTLNDPWTGERQSLTLAEFLPRWHLLGDRAVAGDSLFPPSH